VLNLPFQRTTPEVASKHTHRTVQEEQITALTALTITAKQPIFPL